MNQPVTRYAVSDGLNLAYQVFGQGPPDIVLVPGFISHIEFAWQEPLLERFLRSLAAFARVIAFDKRGMGLSDRDPISLAPNLQQRCADVLAVMDEAGSATANLLAWSEGGPTAIAVTAEAPQRVEGLILVGTAARFSLAKDYPIGIPADVLDEFTTTLQILWGTGVALELYAPSLADIPASREWWAAYQRFAASPGAVAASLRMQFDVDVRPQLKAISAPSLIVHATQDLVVPVECGRYLAQHLPNATLLERDSADHMYWTGDQNSTITAIRNFLRARSPALQRMRRSRRPSYGWDSLTPTEIDVARLVARGMTNPEIAQRLNVSSRTVQTHVAHILTKLDLSRRAEIATQSTARRARESAP
jgi:pimeloyl-ACP methyl ester carboxylesterase/DNA-binding CsgD family transcriptional regulator